MNNLLSILLGIAFVVFGIIQIYAGYIGIEYHLGSIWASIAVFLTLFLQFTLPITIGAFFGAMNVWNWHWFWALIFASPGLAFIIPGTSLLIASKIKNLFKHNSNTVDSEFALSSMITIPKNQNTSKQPEPQEITPLIFRNNKSAFEYACKFMDCTLKKEAKIPALVIEILERGANQPSTTGQDMIIKVASDDGGFLILNSSLGDDDFSALLPKDTRELCKNIKDLKVGDLILWQAVHYFMSENDKKRAEDEAHMKYFPKQTKMMRDERYGWDGYVIAKLEPILDIKKGWKISK